MQEFRPNLISVVVQFNYETDKQVGQSGTQLANKGVPNEIRRAFLGIERGSPNIPAKIQNKMKSKNPIIHPIHFSIIKKPIQIGKSTRNKGVGAIIMYEYFGIYQDLDKFLNAFDDFLSNEVFSKEVNDEGKGKYSYSLSCSEYQIIVGKDWDDIKN